MRFRLRLQWKDLSRQRSAGGSPDGLGGQVDPRGGWEVAQPCAPDGKECAVGVPEHLSSARLTLIVHENPEGFREAMNRAT